MHCTQKHQEVITMCYTDTENMSKILTSQIEFKQNCNHVRNLFFVFFLNRSLHTQSIWHAVEQTRALPPWAKVQLFVLFVFACTTLSGVCTHFEWPLAETSYSPTVFPPKPWAVIRWVYQGDGGVLRELQEPWLPPGFPSLLHWKRTDLRGQVRVPRTCLVHWDKWVIAWLCFRHFTHVSCLWNFKPYTATLL